MRIEKPLIYYHAKLSPHTSGCIAFLISAYTSPFHLRPLNCSARRTAASTVLSALSEHKSGGGGSGGLGPGEVQAVGEEFSLGGGDESRARSGLGFNLSKSGSDGTVFDNIYGLITKQGNDFDFSKPWRHNGPMRQSQQSAYFGMHRFPDLSIHLAVPFTTAQLLRQAHRSLHRALRAVVRRIHNPHPHRLLRFHLFCSQHHIASCSRIADPGLQHCHEDPAAWAQGRSKPLEKNLPWAVVMRAEPGSFQSSFFWRLTTLFFSRIFSEWSWMMILRAWRAVSFGIISAIGGDLSAFREIKRQW
ncbi:unnamed protein product, partial [Vitis vinifera]